jgi:outer membrane protein
MRGVMMKQKSVVTVATMIGFFLLLSVSVSGEDNREGLTLKECLTVALARNPTVMEAVLGIKSAEESIISAQGRHWPRLTLDGAYTRREIPFPYIQAQSPKIGPHFSDVYYSLGPTLTLPIYQGGQVSTGVSLAEVRRDIQVLTAGQTKNDIMANTVNTYNKILQLQQLQNALQASVNALEEQVKNTQLLLDVGRVARVDLLKIEVQFANERQRLLATDEALKTASATLRYLMGEGPEARSPVPALRDRLVAGELKADFSSGLAVARERRPEYLSAKKAVEEAKLNQRLALGRLLPTVNVFATDTRWHGYTPEYTDTLWVAGLNVSIPLFDRSLYADVSRERIQMDRASQRFRAAENQLGLEVANALASLQDSRNRVSATEKAVTQGEESFRIEQERYDSGAGAMVDLLLAQAASINAVSNYTQALFDYNAAVVAFRKATGTVEEYLK